MSLKGKIILSVLATVFAWILIDLYYPYQTDIRKVDGAYVARLDADMWRSYYENKKAKLFFQSAQLMRGQFHFPFIRSHVVSVYVAEAAFVFKKGKSRDDYNKALPPLRKYFASVNDISTIKFNIDSAALTELEWWIIRRDTTVKPTEWEGWLAATASVMYHKPVDDFREYAHLRVQAMVLRDQKNKDITEADWGMILNILNKAWSSFAVACNK